MTTPDHAALSNLLHAAPDAYRPLTEALAPRVRSLGPDHVARFLAPYDALVTKGYATRAPFGLDGDLYEYAITDAGAATFRAAR